MLAQVVVAPAGPVSVKLTAPAGGVALAGPVTVAV